MLENPQKRALSKVWARAYNDNVERFRGGLVFKAHRLLYHSTLGSRVLKKKKKKKKDMR